MKNRADILLVSEGLAPSREKARALIMAGQVYIGDRRVEKAGEMLDLDASPGGAKFNIKGRANPYVSRGGLKLEKALHEFCINLSGKTVLDIGASSGGFTDCALKHGASKVFAVDVGYGQLDWSLRQDARVEVLEKTNARYLSLEALGEPSDFATVDVSFISLQKILPNIMDLLRDDAQGIALIKPQFEAGREQVGKKGVVRDEKVHKCVISCIISNLPAMGCRFRGLTWSPIKGPEGNIEYLLWFDRDNRHSHHSAQDGVDEDIVKLVETAFNELSGKSQA